MMRFKKRKKATRFRGTHTHGRGGKKKARGSGHRGGVGMAGTGKRGDQRKTYVLNLYGNDYFGKSKVLRGRVHIRYEAINIQQIIEGLPSLIRVGKAKESKDKVEINLKGYKVLGDVTSKIDKKWVINASAVSKSALEKIKEAGGEVIVDVKKKKKVEVKKTDKVKEKKEAKAEVKKVTAREEKVEEKKDIVDKVKKVAAKEEKVEVKKVAVKEEKVEEKKVAVKADKKEN